MKTTRIFAISIFICLLSACEVNQSVNKDLTTGASSRGDGLSCDEVVMQVNGKPEKRNSFAYGERVKFIFNNLSGFTRKGNKVFPGLSVMVKNGKDTVLFEADVLSDLENGTDLSPLQLNAHFLSALPFENQENYKAYVKIWDKKGKGTFTYEMPFTVTKNNLLNVKSSGLSYKDIYLWDDDLDHVVAGREVDSENQLILIIDRLSGMSTIDGQAYPALSVEITDSKGNKILSNANILQQYETSGFPADELTESQIPATIAFSPGKIYNPCQLKAVLTDQNSDRRVDIEAELEIE